MRINNNEQWAVIEDYPGYRVSSFGRVYSLKAKDFMKQWTHKDHEYISLWNDKGNKKFQIHRLVAKAFGKWFEGCVIHHADGNPLNNNLNNLEPMTSRMHKQIHGKDWKPSEYQIERSVEAHEIKVEQWTKDRTELIKVWDSAAKAARALGINRKHITQVCTGKPYDKRGYVRKSAGGYYWKYHETNN